MNGFSINKLWLKPTHFLALGFGSGCASKAPGTFGSLVALIFVPLLFLIPCWIYAIFLVCMSVFGVWLCDVVSKNLNIEDPGCIVWDEFVGIWFTFFAINLHDEEHYWLWLVVGFGLFRLFDIAKPFPVNYFDNNIKGGLGIMLDDIVAGILACINLHLLIWLF